MAESAATVNGLTLAWAWLLVLLPLPWLLRRWLAPARVLMRANNGTAAQPLRASTAPLMPPTAVADQRPAKKAAKNKASSTPDAPRNSGIGTLTTSFLGGTTVGMLACAGCDAPCAATAPAE